MTAKMRRRAFITLLGGAAAAWPLAARAQQARMRRVGVLLPYAADDREGQARLVAFQQALAELGWSDSGNVRIETRWGAGDPDRYRQYAAELVALAPDVVLAVTTAVAAALQRETRSVPIVFVGAADPVGAGVVASLARPGGNITGFTTFEYGLSPKWLALLKEIAPHVTRAAVIRDSTVAAEHGLLGGIRSGSFSVLHSGQQRYGASPSWQISNSTAQFSKNSTATSSGRSTKPMLLGLMPTSPPTS